MLWEDNIKMDLKEIMAFDITPVLSSLNFKEVKSLLDKQATFF
jgi:hypothetical protein